VQRRRSADGRARRGVAGHECDLALGPAAARAANTRLRLRPRRPRAERAASARPPVATHAGAGAASLLAAAKIPGPYVVVGHSWGGLLARLFAYVYPAQTAGVVLLDATTFPYLTPARARRLHRRNREGIDLASAVAESDAIKSLGQVPLVVLGSNKPRLDAKLLAAQDAEAALSTESVDAIASLSTHYIQRPAPIGQPQVVVTAVRAVVAATRTRGTLPPCAQLYAGLAVSCRS
jgi:pimeloyl-ACP methyl ester carboxylesterase